MRVVTLRALGLGDLLVAVPALRAVARAWPSARHELVTSDWVAPLVPLVDPAFSVVPVPAATSAPLRGPLPVAAGPDVAVNLHGAGPQSHRALLELGPGRLVAFAHAEVPASAGLPAFDPVEHERLRWCRLLERSGVPCDPDDLALDVAPSGAAAGVVVVQVGAGEPEKRWPLDRWAEVVRALTVTGRRVVLTGGPSDEADAALVARSAGLGADAVLAGRLDLPALAAVVAGADAVLSADTGIAHLATALGRPSVVLFGPVDPALWGPPADRPRHVALRDLEARRAADVLGALDRALAAAPAMGAGR